MRRAVRLLLLAISVLTSAVPAACSSGSAKRADSSTTSPRRAAACGTALTVTHIPDDVRAAAQGSRLAFAMLRGRRAINLGGGTVGGRRHANKVLWVFHVRPGTPFVLDGRNRTTGRRIDVATGAGLDGSVTFQSAHRGRTEPLPSRDPSWSQLPSYVAVDQSGCFEFRARFARQARPDLLTVPVYV